VTQQTTAEHPQFLFLMILTCRQIVRWAHRNIFGVRFISSTAMIAYLFTFSISPLVLRSSGAASSEPTGSVTSPAPTGMPTPAPFGTVNRTVPAVLPPSAHVKFSVQPTDTEIEQARIFDERFIRIGVKPGPQENVALAKVLSAYVEASITVGPSAKDTVDLRPIEQFVLSHPSSSWEV
jgi:hypothetical protein